MFSEIPVITNDGMTLMLLAAEGQEFTITKFQVGSGVLSDGETPKGAHALKAVELDNIAITKAENTEQDGYIQLTGEFNNYDLQDGFLWSELGLIAEDENGNEILFAYGYDNTHAEQIRPAGENVVISQKINMIVALGDTQNITVHVLEDAEYANREAFEAHLHDYSNPHRVTAEQIGAALEEHTHSADDITDGILPVSRGGTGVSSLAELSAMLNLGFVIGSFVGDGTQRRSIELGFKPSAVYMFPLLTGSTLFYSKLSGTTANTTITGLGQAHSHTFSSYRTNVAGFYFAPEKNVYHGGCGTEYASCDAEVMINRGHGGAGVTNTGFLVGYSNSGDNRNDINVKDRVYFYIALK